MADKKQKKYNNPVSATLTGISDLFRKHEPAGELKPSDRLDGKTVLVDGASSGLGFAVAVDMAKRGASLIMACRSGIPEKGELVKMFDGENLALWLHELCYPRLMEANDRMAAKVDSFAEYGAPISEDSNRILRESESVRASYGAPSQKLKGGILSY